MRTHPSFLLVVLLAAMALPSPAVAETYPPARAGWMLGFGLGGGSAATNKVGGSSDREFGGAGSFRVGYVFQPQLALGMESSSWLKTHNSASTTLDVTTAAVAFYPGAKELALRAGVGFGTTSASDRLNGRTFTISESGFGTLVGAAYEYRIRRTLAVSPQVDFSWMSVTGFEVNYVNATLGLNWYFIPKP